VIVRVPLRTKQPRESAENEKLKCEVEYYTLHKHFYGNGWAKFPKMLIRRKERAGFYMIVSITVSN
jgi:hypothetical protein